MDGSLMLTLKTAMESASQPVSGMSTNSLNISRCAQEASVRAAMRRGAMNLFMSGLSVVFIVAWWAVVAVWLLAPTIVAVVGAVVISFARATSAFLEFVVETGEVVELYDVGVSVVFSDGCDGC